MGNRPLKILIIEDNPEDQATYQRLLKRDREREYCFMEAETGGEGVDLLRQTPVDCVLLDYNLPDMDGIEVLDELSKDPQFTNTPVILLTGHGSEMVAVGAMKSGATDYLIKTALTRELLVRTILHAMEKIAADRALKEHHTFLNTLIETIPDSIFYKDREGKCTGCNKAFEAFLGVPRQKIVGKRLYEIASKEAGDQSDRLDRRLIHRPGAVTIETTIRDKAGRKRDIILHQASYQDLEGRVAGFVGSMVDITERKEMEELLKQTARELSKANRQIVQQHEAVIEEERLKVLLQMAGATAHGIVQPLSQLLENIRLIEQNRDDPETMERHIARVETAGKRIAEMLRKIQTSPFFKVKPQPGEPVPMDLERSISVLCVDPDEPACKRMRELLLDKGDIRVFHVRDLEEAFEVIKTSGVDIILMEYLLPGGTVFDFLISMESRGIDIPVAVITGRGDEMVASQVIKSGAYDYLAKARLSRESLFRVIANALEKHRLNREMRLAVKKMTEMSTRDELTGLYNRRYFMEVLEREMKGAERYGRELALCLMDLDFFKRINDTHGHPAGDEVLRQTARLLREFSRESDIPCRYGGEEFAVVITDTSMGNARLFCDRFREKLENHVIEYQGISLRVTVSIGVAGYCPASGQSITTFLSQTDKALYSAKEQGRNRVIAVDEK